MESIRFFNCFLLIKTIKKSVGRLDKTSFTVTLFRKISTPIDDLPAVLYHLVSSYTYFKVHEIILPAPNPSYQTPDQLFPPYPNRPLSSYIDVAADLPTVP